MPLERLRGRWPQESSRVALEAAAQGRAVERGAGHELAAQREIEGRVEQRAGEAEGLGDAVGSCAIAMLASLSIAIVIAKICFIKFS